MNSRTQHRWKWAGLALAAVLFVVVGWPTSEAATRATIAHPKVTPMLSLTAGNQQPTAALSPDQLQVVGWMEEALLGAIQANGAVADRLATLEMALFAKTYPADSSEQRLARLDEALRSRKEAALARQWRDEQANRPNSADEWTENSENSATTAQPTDVSVRWSPNQLTNPSVASSASSQPAANAQRPAWLPPDPAAQPTNMPPSSAWANPTLPSTTATPYGTDPVQPPAAQEGNQWESTPSPQAMADSLSNLEKTLLKTTYPAEPVGPRLNRLEMAVFHNTAANQGLSEDERLQRLIAVATTQTDAANDQLMRSAPPTWQTILPVLSMVLLMLL